MLLMLCCGSLLAQQHNQQQIQRLNLVFSSLRSNYVDDVDLEPIVEAAIRASLNELDPHSKYLSREEMIALRTRLRGEFAGVGIRYIVHNDTIVVRTTIEKSPAERAKILPNDRIISIDNRSAIGLSTDSIATLLRGKANSKVRLGVVRHGESKPLSINLQRDNIESSAITAAFRIGSVGYIAVSAFSKPLASEFYDAYLGLGDISSLVVDLRDNEGGAITSAIDLSALFLRKGDVIVSTEGRNNTVVYDKKKDGTQLDIPLVVLINESSASASEIFAGAMQDHDRSVVVGRTSYGKGLVQRVIDFKDGTGITLTVARYKTPSGRVIQRPYTMGDRAEYLRDTMRYMHPDSISYDDMPVFRTLNSGRKVYGGGGITPDIYIGVDSLRPSSVVRRAQASAIFEHVAIDILDRLSPKSMVERYPTMEIFDLEFELGSELMALFYGRADVTAEELTPQDRRYIETMLMATIAESLYGGYARQYIYGLRYDKMTQRAIAIAGDKGSIEAILR